MDASLFKSFRSGLDSFREDLRALCRPALLLSLLYLIGIWAILRANIYYCDDIGRATEGYAGWDFFSRYLSVFLSHILHADGYLADIAPLPQFLACLLMGLASAALAFALNGRKTPPLPMLLATLPLGLCPYFLECFSYRYDAPYMAVSVLASILPILFLDSGWLLFGAASFLGALVMCLTYQASSGIFPMLVIALCFVRWSRGEELRRITRAALLAAAAYLAALLFFRVFLMRYVDDYVSVAISKTGLLSSTLSHYRLFYSAILKDFKPLWLLLIGLMLLLFPIVCAIGSRRGKLSVFFLSFPVLAIMLLLVFGVFPLLRAPLFAPRSMYGFGAFLAIVAATVCGTERLRAVRIVPLALSWVFVVFAFTYGNALDVQDDYARFRTEAVLHDLNSLEVFGGDEEKIVEIRGSVGLAPQLENHPRDYRMLDDLLYDGFSGETLWDSYAFFHDYGLRHVSGANTPVSSEALPVLLDTPWHCIQGDGREFLITLK